MSVIRHMALGWGLVTLIWFYQGCTGDFEAMYGMGCVNTLENMCTVLPLTARKTLTVKSCDFMNI